MSPFFGAESALSSSQSQVLPRLSPSSQAILDHAPLWTTLEDVDVALFEEVDRVRCVAERSKGQARRGRTARVAEAQRVRAGSLTRLSMTVNISGELALDVLPVVATTRMILSEISKAGAKNLEEIALDLRPFKHGSSRL